MPARLIPPDDASLLPLDARERVTAVRDKMVRDVAGAVVDIEPQLRKSADAVKREIIKVAELPPSRQRAAIRAIMARYHVVDADAIADAVSGQLVDAAGYAERYSEVITATRLAALKGVTVATVLGDSRAAFLLREGSGPTEAAVRLAARKLGTSALPKPRTSADKVAQAELSRFRGTNNVSERLHGKAVKNSRAAANAVLRNIRESESVAETARNMQRLLRKGGKELAQNDKLPRLIADLQKHGRAMAAGGGPEHQRAWNNTLGRIKQYQRGLRETGTVRKAYLDLIQTVTSKQFKLSQIDATVERWSYYKQRYRAEVWIRNETATAYRNMAIDQDKGKPWIVGYVWRMHRQTHRRWVRRGKAMGRVRRSHRKPGKKKKFGGKHCICENLNGKRFSPETVSEYPGMGHVHCNCTWEAVYDRRRMMDAPITAEEERWLDG